MTEEDFGDLYRSLRDPVFLFAIRRVGSEAAADVVSETFEIAWRKRADFPKDPKMWAAWVVGIAKNKVLQEIQRRSRKHHDNRFVEDWPGAHRQPSPEDVARAVIDSDNARRIYSRLTPAEQLLFDVAFLRELSADDCAHALGISTSAFTSRVSRLRQRLRYLEGEEVHEPDPAISSGGASE
ncbi:RNA polymerase sigma factor [Aeromicrobium sp. UC242_57]|uniref:RNA polymerase sigma factor n=1 Tax=Aeromicrobium sp. UC242_57 TaxID=3374624 RepID=UPI0037948BA0